MHLDCFVPLLVDFPQHVDLPIAENFGFGKRDAVGLHIAHLFEPEPLTERNIADFQTPKREVYVVVKGILCW